MALTWNPSDKSSSVTLSGGNLTASVSGLGSNVVASVRTTAPVTGKIYFELDIRTSFVSFVALATSSAPLDASGYGSNWPGLNDYTVAAVLFDGNIYQNSSNIGGGPFDYDSNGAYACFAIDVPNKDFWGKTTVAATDWNQSGTANPATGVGGADFSGIAAGDLYILIGLQGSQTVVANFGATAFNQTPPSGFAGPDSGGTAYTLVAASGSYTLTGTAATLSRARNLAAASGSYAVTGTDVAFAKGRTLAAQSGSYALTGAAALFARTYSLTAATTAYALTGTAAALQKGRTLIADAGVYVLAGADAALKFGRKLAAGSGSYSLVGTAVTLVRGRALAAAEGVYALVGSAVALGRTYVLDALSGQYALTGQSVSLEWSGAPFWVPAPETAETWTPSASTAETWSPVSANTETWTPQ